MCVSLWTIWLLISDVDLDKVRLGTLTNTDKHLKQQGIIILPAFYFNQQRSNVRPVQI
ncbi:hypothetical protein NIES4075_12730 [Tolypothrix sp. NIES-4075]|nr:hypothetical protein NIES4075_12730 [Tolypothrix sp. NIES-4075]